MRSGWGGREGNRERETEREVRGEERRELKSGGKGRRRQETGRTGVLRKKSNMLIVLRVSTHEHDRSSYIYVGLSLIFLTNISCFSVHKSYMYLVRLRLISKVFMLFQIVISLRFQLVVVLC